MIVNFLVVSFLMSFFTVWGVIALFGRFKIIGIDGKKGGPQKFHQNPTPRTGGIGIFIVFLAVSTMLLYIKHEDGFIVLTAVASPAFFAGLAEDLIEHVRPLIRLGATILSGLLGAYLLGATLTRTGFPLIDGLLSIGVIALPITVFMVAGVTNAFNIIDGYNGLASMVSIIILLALGYVSFKVSDSFLLYTSFIMVFIILGFFMWNYPFGKIFLGDGGVYFIGFIIAEISILLVISHKQVSPWFPLLLCIYPIFETVFSIYRKKIVRKMSPGLPDGLHLHMLIYKRVVKSLFGLRKNENNDKLYNNFATSPFLWLLASFGVIPAVLFWNNTIALMIFTAIFIIIYISVYKMIINFKFKIWKSAAFK